MKWLKILLLLVLLSSCSSSKVIDLGGATATKGIDVSQKALTVYSSLLDQSGIDKSQQDKIKVLTNPNPSTMKLPDTKASDFSNQLQPRIEAYQKLLTVYTEFNLLTDSKFSDRSKEALISLENSYNAIAKIPDLPEDIRGKLPNIFSIITQTVQAKEIKKHNEILYSLSQVYLELWNDDKPIWDEYLDLVYNSYSDGLSTVDSKRYDVNKISQSSMEPYSDSATIILMYRLSNRDEIMKQKNDLKQQLTAFGKALQELNKTHAEMSKQATDISSVISSLNKIEELLKDKQDAN
ncbi:hypothetical protein ACEN2I_03425 [Flavobacterium sp. W22_SRS_FK3]|uniref:hypothetical protein n=1 Tax=Flavobacterium sp. W22_SRS_FK3 TaxID=3240275 RepID=UPI003F92DA0D